MSRFVSDSAGWASALEGLIQVASALVDQCFAMGSLS